MKFFLITWFTSAALFFVVVDQNTYIVRGETKALKDRASIAERLVVSVLAGALYSGCNSLLISGFLHFENGGDPNNDMRDYHINIFYSEEDEGYIADIPDLKVCSAFGKTPEKALQEALIAKAAWLEAARQEGKPIPRARYRPVIYQVA